MKKYIIYFFLILFCLTVLILSFKFFISVSSSKQIKKISLEQEKKKMKKQEVKIIKVYNKLHKGIYFDTSKTKENILISNFYVNKNFDDDLAISFRLSFAAASLSNDKKWVVSNIEIGDMAGSKLFYIPEKLIVPNEILGGQPANFKNNTFYVTNMKNYRPMQVDINKILLYKNKFESIDKWREKLVKEQQTLYLNELKSEE